MFYGGSSAFNFNFALNLAKALNCKEKEGEGFCDNCNICKTISNFSFPDLIITSKDPEKKELTEDRIGSLSQKDSFINKIYTSSLSSFKVGIIKDFHLANNTSQNVILKCLEEPPKNTVIILIADNLGNIKETILSRCQLYEFPKPKKDDISKFFASSLFSDLELKEVLDFVISDLSLISKFKDNKENLNFYKENIKDFCSLCFSNSYNQKIKYYNQVSQDIKKNNNFEDYIHIWEVFFDKLINKNYESSFFNEIFLIKCDIKLEKNLLNLYNIKEGYLKNLNTNILLFKFVLNI